jgi:lysine 2,3-aminomutase
VTKLRARLSGLAMPAYMLDIPGGFGKVPLNADHVLKANAGWRIRDMRGDWHEYPAEPEGAATSAPAEPCP